MVAVTGIFFINEADSFVVAFVVWLCCGECNVWEEYRNDRRM